MEYKQSTSAPRRPDDTNHGKTTATRHHHQDCNCGSGEACSCDTIVRERNRFYTGKYMTARSFAGEQEYFLSRQRLHNRTLHGWGIVCGLDVRPHKNPNCQNSWVVVCAGIAIDCCGREIVLEKDVAFELPQRGEADADPYESPLLLGIRYVEEKIENVPALYHEGDCDPNRREADRVRECFKLEVLREIPAGCWATSGGSLDCPCQDDEDEVPGSATSCLNCDCPCGEVVPLALLTFDCENPIEIDTAGRKQLPVAKEYLTHICWTSWKHGDEIPLQRLREEMRGELKIKFDRKLLPTDGDATGINSYTFVVQYGNVQRGLEFLPTQGNISPYIDPDDDCVAVFDIDKDVLRGRDTIAGSTVFVTLKCDFIPDCHGIPVSGAHLNGRLKSGNGVPGGTFESWFRVGAGGYEYEANQEAAQ